MDPKLAKQFKELGNLYEILGIKPTATNKEIKKAYKNLSLIHHPDKSKDPKSADIFHKLKISSELLLNEETRAKFDSQLASVREQEQRYFESNRERASFANDLINREKNLAHAKEEAERDRVAKEMKKNADIEKFRTQVLEEQLKKKEEEQKSAFSSAKTSELNSIVVKWSKKLQVVYSKEMFKGIFGTFGSIRDIILLADKRKAIIEYDSRHAAMKAVEHHKKSEIDDGLSVKPLIKKFEFEGGSQVKAAPALDLTMNAGNIRKIQDFYNCDSNAYLGRAHDEIRRQMERDRIIQDIINSEKN